MDPVVAESLMLLAAPDAALGELALSEAALGEAALGMLALRRRWIKKYTTHAKRQRQATGGGGPIVHSSDGHAPRPANSGH